MSAQSSAVLRKKLIATSEVKLLLCVNKANTQERCIAGAVCWIKQLRWCLNCSFTYRYSTKILISCPILLPRSPMPKHAIAAFSVPALILQLHSFRPFSSHRLLHYWSHTGLPRSSHTSSSYSCTHSSHLSTWADTRSSAFTVRASPQTFITRSSKRSLTHCGQSSPMSSFLLRCPVR